MDSIETHRRHAAALRRVATGPDGATDPGLRAAVLARAETGGPITEPYEDLARQIGEGAYLVTDAQVAAARVAAGSDKGAFEIILSACIGAGLTRLESAFRVIQEASDATA